MITLPRERVGPYVRALSAALTACAPHNDFVPLAEVQAHLGAMDPELSGPLLLPAEVEPRSGMPSFPWMERAIAERALARDADPPSEEEVTRALRLDPELGERLGSRRRLQQHLLWRPVLPAMRLDVQLRRLGSTADFAVIYDRIEPLGTWLRVRVEVQAPTKDAGALKLDANGRIVVDPGLSHLLTRHSAVPLLAMQRTVESACRGRVARLARSRIGPFWFPGVTLPEAVPAALGRGLVLHLQTEVVADDVQTAAHRDPLVATQTEKPRDGQKVFRERRFAAVKPMVEPVHAWCLERGVRTTVIGF
ncbi:MAG: hypothetical protein EP330_22815 [Deltaproteobacteria bacterium]|nr:MAG: hypothetical protein EP330_22815 [Deltaproteobacteria bacterium]